MFWDVEFWVESFRELGLGFLVGRVGLGCRVCGRFPETRDFFKWNI